MGLPVTGAQRPKRPLPTSPRAAGARGLPFAPSCILLAPSVHRAVLFIKQRSPFHPRGICPRGLGAVSPAGQGHPRPAHFLLGDRLRPPESQGPRRPGLLVSSSMQTRREEVQRKPLRKAGSAAWLGAAPGPGCAEVSTAGLCRRPAAVHSAGTLGSSVSLRRLRAPRAGG